MKYSRIHLFLVLGAFLCGGAAGAKSYSITNVQIDAQLRKNGSMLVSEHRTFSFNGSFTYSYRVFPKDRVSYEKFMVLENGQPFRLDNSMEPGSFQILEKRSTTEVRWYYSAADEQRIFSLSYQVKHAVVQLDSAAALYYKFIGDDWTQEQQHVLLTIVPPEDLGKDQLSAWLHGPLWAEYRLEKNGTISAWCDQFPKKTFFEVHALYPVELFPKAVKNNILTRRSVMEKERIWVEGANQKRLAAVKRLEQRAKMTATAIWTSVLVSLLAVLFGIWLYFTYGRRPELPMQIQPYSTEIPQDDSPALVSYLLGSQVVTGNAMVATLFHLANRGYLRMEEVQRSEKKFFGGTREVTDYTWKLDRRFLAAHALRYPFEESLLQFLFDKLADGGDELPVKTMTAKSSEMIRFFQKWKVQVKQQGKDRSWFNESSKRGRIYAIVAGAAIDLVALILTLINGLPMFLLMLPSGLLLILLGLAIFHRTAGGEELARRWKALSRYLKDGHYKSGDQQSFLDKAGVFFVYAPVLGLWSRHFKEMAALLPAESGHRYVHWYLPAMHSEGFSGAAFGSGFSSMMATASSSMSSATGSGGGASGGGGGGAGGGGGGAG